MKFLKWRLRKYPIRCDEYGRSARKQAFSLFGWGYHPSQIYREGKIPVSKRTLFRYYEDWKKERRVISYSVLRRYMRRNPEFNQKTIEALSELLGLSIPEVILRMQRPWGVMQAMKGEWPDYVLKREQSDIENRLEAALRLVLFIELYGHKPEMIKNLVRNIIADAACKEGGTELKTTDQPHSKHK